MGPRLATVVVLLTMRFRLSRVKVKELVAELFGLQVSTGLIDQTIRETGRAVAPLEEELVAEIEQAALVHAEETSWREAGRALWVFVTAQTVLYPIGYRTQEIVANVLSAAFQGTLMTDGYAVYRSYPNRLRCWAHLMRKAVGLSESTHQRVAAIGQQLHAAFSGLQEAIYQAWESAAPPGALASIRDSDRDVLAHPGTASGRSAREATCRGPRVPARLGGDPAPAVRSLAAADEQ